MRAGGVPQDQPARFPSHPLDTTGEADGMEEAGEADGVVEAGEADGVVEAGDDNVYDNNNSYDNEDVEPGEIVKSPSPSV